MTFSEVVNVSSIVLQSIFLPNAFDSTPKLNLNDFQPRYDKNRTDIINFELTNVTVAKLLQFLLFGNSSYLCGSFGFIADLSGNLIEELSCRQGILAANHTRDSTNPVVLNFNIDFRVSPTTFELCFDEPVVFNPGNATFFSTLGLNSTVPIDAITLTPSSCVLFSIAHQFTNDIKMHQSCVMKNCNVYLPNAFVRDLSGNALAESRISVQTYKEDQEPPTIDSFELNMDQGFLVVGFSEPINASTIDVESFSLENSP